MMGDIFSYLYQFADVFAFLILSAAGLAIVFGMMGIINMAHGEFIMCGAYVTVGLVHVGLPLIAAQLCGAIVASLLLYSMFSEAILEFERRHGLLRGGPGSELSGMVFGEYFPNPAMFGTAEDAWRIVGLQGAFLAELVGTALLALLVSAVTHARNRARPAAGTEALLIGVGVAAHVFSLRTAGIAFSAAVAVLVLAVLASLSRPE